jgi:hypothetical protein
MKSISIAALILVAGCGKDDLCSGMLGQDVVCYTVHVGGSIDGSNIDQLQVDATYSLTSSTTSGDETTRSVISLDNSNPGAGSTSLPIAFPLVFQLPAQVDAFNSKVVVVAKANMHNVGVGSAKLGVGQFGDSQPTAGSSHSVNVTLSQATSADCFNPNIVGNTTDKTDRDCGGSTCPACVLNEKCNTNQDCVAPLICTIPSTSSVFICVPPGTM